MRKRDVANKRGLAPVLSIALITLGVIAAVALLWAFASKSIESRERIIDPGCFTADLSVVSCQTYGSCAYNLGSGIYDADILVKRGPGKADLTGIRFSFEGSFGDKKVYDASLTSLLPGYTLEELQSLRFNYPARIPSYGVDNLVRAIPLIGEDYEVCPVPSQPLRCSLAGTSPPSVGSIPGASSVSGLCCQCPRNESECYNGNDLRYPIDINGIVLDASTGLPHPFGFPLGNFSVCCASVPQALAGQTISC